MVEYHQYHYFPKGDINILHVDDSGISTYLLIFKLPADSWGYHMTSEYMVINIIKVLDNR